MFMYLYVWMDGWMDGWIVRPGASASDESRAGKEWRPGKENARRQGRQNDKGKSSYTADRVARNTIP